MFAKLQLLFWLISPSFSFMFFRTAHRQSQNLESRSNARCAALEDELHDSHQRVKDLEATSRRYEERLLRVPLLEEEISILTDVKNENKKLRSNVERW